MDQKLDLSERRPDQIRRQVEETRSELTAKLEALEQKVRATFADAKNAVVETVESVRQSVDGTVQAVEGTVHNAVDSVKHALDIRRQVERHPWSMLAGSLAAGYVLGHLVPRLQSVNPPISRRSADSPPHSHNGRPDLQRARAGPRIAALVAAPTAPERGWFNTLTEQFNPEIQQLKSLAIGSAMSLARDAIKESVAPPLGKELAGMMDRLTIKLGGHVPAGASNGFTS